jgi:RNA polymerase sigma factor (sigma-70 family)
VFRRRPPADDLSRVYREHVGAVYGFFAYSLREAAAEDLTSAAFERVLRAWPSYDPAKGSERSWILTIARNLLVDHYRRESHRDTVSTDEHPALLEGLAAGDEPLDRILSADELRGWLRVLGEREREIVALRYAADLPAAEIAEIVGLTAANVHQILSRSLRRLREAAGVTSSA